MTINQWLAAYERRKASGLEGPNKALLSSKFDLESMSWDEIREIPIPEISENATFGTCSESLRKSWYALKRNRAEGNYHNKDLELRINRIQNALGFERTIFDDLDQNWVDNELSMEQHKQGEQDEDEDEVLSPEERQLNQQLKKEERDAELAEWGLEDFIKDEKSDNDPWQI
jgi:hypothetical protein